MKTSFVVVLSVLLLRCPSLNPHVEAQAPAVEFVREVRAPSVGPDTVFHIVELVVRRTENFDKDFSLAKPVIVDRVTAQLSYSALGKPCGDAAIVLSVVAGDNVIAAFDVRGDTRFPMNVVETMEFPGGISVPDLHYYVLDDMCHTTDVRLVLLMHRTRGAS